MTTRLAVTGAVALVLALVASLAPQPARTPIGPDNAAAADCAWQRHAKRVVKKVRRHGKIRRVVRRKVWWSCVPQATAPVAAAPAPPAPPAPEPEPEANRLGVAAREFYFVLSRPSVKPGTVMIELNNQGEDPHNLNLQLEGDAGEPLQIPETDSEERNVASFDLPAGKYKLWCSLPEHEEKGMAATLQVAE
ncbi:MAG TPA: plastocyanin/azurin family copper-binding protein [Solirubrobacterales bacterium]|nr:plastocyanin/azurin family copper-binding protein [Solirubrobacterales bacterium]